MRVPFFSLLVPAALFFLVNCLFGAAIGQPLAAAHDDHANFLSGRSGAYVYACSSTDSTDFMVHNILEGSEKNSGIWRTAHNATGPHWVIIELPRPTELTTFSFNTSTLNEAVHEGVTPRGIMIEFSTEGPDRGYKRMAHEFLKRHKDKQIVGVAADTARWVRITLQNNFGNPHFTELGTVYAYNDFAINQYEMMLSVENQLDLHNIVFESESAEISKESLPIIESLVDILLRHPSWHVTIEGHTDRTGNETFNLTLSKKRAASVVSMLEKYGIERNRLQSKGLGSSQPLVQEESQEAYAQNRRVTFKVKP